MAPRPTLDPTSTTRQTSAGEVTTRRHPAFAQIAVVRSTGDHTLYGSEFEHQHAISLMIVESEEHRENHCTRRHGGKRLIEVRVAESEFARIFTSVGNAEGVPCTLMRLGADAIPGITPPEPTETVFQRELRATLHETTAALADVRASLAAIIAAGPTKGALRDQIEGQLARVEQNLRSNIPFIGEMFSEHVEMEKGRAVAEIQGFVTQTIVETGLASIRAPQAAGTMALTDGREIPPTA